MVVWRGGRLRLRLEFESVSAGSGSWQGRGLVAGPLLLLLCRVRVRLPVVACETAGKLVNLSKFPLSSRIQAQTYICSVRLYYF